MPQNNNSLPSYVKIRTSGMQFNNGLHTQYHRELYRAVTKEDAQKLHLAEALIKDWEKWIDIAIDVSRESAFSLFTKELTQKNKYRSHLMVYIFKSVRLQRQSPVEAVSKAANILYLQLKPYFGTQNSNHLAKGAYVEGLLLDINKYTAEAQTLSLEPAINTLRSINEEYNQLWSKQLDESISRKLPPSREVRKHLDAIYREVSSYIQAAYILATKEEDKRMILALVKILNQITSDLNTTHKLSMSQKAAAEERRKKKKEEEEAKKKVGEKPTEEKPKQKKETKNTEQELPKSSETTEKKSEEPTKSTTEPSEKPSSTTAPTPKEKSNAE